MKLFQCGHCGAVENEDFASRGCRGNVEEFFNWEGIEDRRGKLLCSVCAPTKHRSGNPTRYGKWHGKFERIIFPLGTWEQHEGGGLINPKTNETYYVEIELQPHK